MENLIVTIPQGKLRGSIDKLFDGAPYYSFKGIPFAETPVGQQRFEAPLPPKGWPGIRDATQHGSVCPQYDIMTSDFVEGNEDCLFLNVYTKSLISNFPVMVYIHGGAFMSGSGDSSTYGPQFLIQHDVLLVTFNYRLETLGFLCLDTPDVPGNAGLKDQVAALRWVKENIGKFGGDSENVTIFGQSAGAASVTYHMLSNMSNGLFHKAIAQSGCCSMDWTIDIDPVNRAFRAGKVLGIETEDKRKLLQFLQKVQPNDLIRLTVKTRTFDERHRGLSIFFTPVVENTTDVFENFITEDPVDLLLKGKINNIPFMTGCTSGEGQISAQNLLSKSEFYNKHPSYLLPKEISRNVSKDKLIVLGERLKKFYFKDKGICLETLDHIIDYQSDRLQLYNCHRFAHYYSVKAPTFMYNFDCNTELNYLKKQFDIHVPKACHTDDLYYMFCNAFNSELYEKHANFRNIINKITKVWTNFAKTGNPTPDNKMEFKWEPYTPTQAKYLLIDENEMKMSSHLNPDRMEFWNEMYKEAGLPYISRQTPSIPAKY